MAWGFDKNGHGFPVEHFTTDAFAPRDRHEAWANRHWPAIGPLFESKPIEAFHNVTDIVDIGGLKLFYSEISGQRYVRSADMLRSYDPEALNVLLLLEGRADGMIGERSFAHTPGTILIGDVGGTSSHASTATRTVRLTLTRAQALEMGFDMRAMHGLVLDSQASALFASHVSRLPALLPELRTEDGPRLARTVLDLLTLAVSIAGRTVAETPETRRSVATLRARDEIERRLGSPSLGVADLCQRLQISRASLQRLFEEEGGVGTYIRARRLEAVRGALADPLNHETIGTLADRFGFSDSAHLSRLFRARYGCAPSDYRMEARTRRG